jgi:opacity protein-like surface antigen
VRALRVTTTTAAFAAALAATLAAPTAHAQEDRIDPLGGQVHDRHSSQNFAIEFRASPYKPNVDSDPALNGQTPYKNVFRDVPRLFVGAEIDWQVLRIPHFGSLGPGLSAGYTTASDPASFTMPHNGTTVSGETTSLWIAPFTLSAVLRVDVLWRDLGIPVVPYAKLGVAYALWRASNTLGTSSADGVSGTGFSLGTHVGLGLAIDLNPFDPYSAQNLDDAMGINNTYIFAEWDWDNYTGLGFQSDPLRVGGSNWIFGLALEL